jgi:lipopolysaccharide/colanic/teichoic acid biosynthesis glycosyltransferase
MCSVLPKRGPQFPRVTSESLELSHKPARQFLKRGFDLAIAVPLFVLLAPLMARSPS